MKRQKSKSDAQEKAPRTDLLPTIFNKEEIWHLEGKVTRLIQIGIFRIFDLSYRLTPHRNRDKKGVSKKERKKENVDERTNQKRQKK